MSVGLQRKVAKILLRLDREILCKFITEFEINTKLIRGASICLFETRIEKKQQSK
jgi:hypothetical protein